MAVLILHVFCVLRLLAAGYSITDLDPEKRSVQITTGYFEYVSQELRLCWRAELMVLQNDAC